MTDGFSLSPSPVRTLSNACLSTDQSPGVSVPVKAKPDIPPAYPSHHARRKALGCPQIALWCMGRVTTAPLARRLCGAGATTTGVGRGRASESVFYISHPFKKFTPFSQGFAFCLGLLLLVNSSTLLKNSPISPTGSISSPNLHLSHSAIGLLLLLSGSPSRPHLLLLILRELRLALFCFTSPRRIRA